MEAEPGAAAATVEQRPRCACLMMQKNEATLLLPWVLYHGYLFGFPNLFIFDNGSTEPAAIDALNEAARLGANVDRRHDQKFDFVRKGEVLGEQMRTLRDEGGWDVLIPLDCDEFLALRDGNTVSFDRARILAGLSGLVDDERIPHVINAFTNTLGTIDRFRPEPYLKTFVQARGFLSLDHGFHQILSSLSETPMDSGFVYIHCHAKPFDRVVRDAREKLAYWCDVDSPASADKLEATNGAGWHLVKYLRMTEREYLATFSHDGTVELPGFARRLAEVGADTGFLLGLAAPVGEVRIPESPAWRVLDGETPHRSGNGVMVFGSQGPELAQLMGALAAAGIGVGRETEAFLNRHWIAAFASGDALCIRRELLVLAAQPAPWASWFPQPGLLTAEMAEALRWPRAIQIVTADEGREQDCAVLRGLDLPVLQIQWAAAVTEPGLLAQTLLAYLGIGDGAERVDAVARSVSAAGFEGWIDGASDSEVWGWCWRRGSDERQRVELFVDGLPRASVTADVFRGDLQEARVGDGHHGFRFEFAPGTLAIESIIEVAAAGTGGRILGSGSRLGDLSPR